ncbi:MAG: 30S ribosomal protein S9 [Bacilli bacterium]
MVKEKTYLTTGRRKSAVARVKVTVGKGNITVNGKDVNDFFFDKLLIIDLTQPLKLTDTVSSYDVVADVNGGGASGQAGAIRLGIARALIEINPDFRKVLKENKMLTRDSRIKERKKYGLKKARKASQFSKR